MKNILFVCNGNSSRSIIAETIVNNEYSDNFKSCSTDNHHSGMINDHPKKFNIY